MRSCLTITTAILFLVFAARPSCADTRRPNIVYILADDLGYGDVKALNENGKIATPHIDQLAREGMRFTDAHAGSSVCTPTRYGVLTGRYAWRSRLQAGVCWGYSVPLIASDRLTVASMLQSKGYRTACIGKWHLGLGWKRRDPMLVPDDDPRVPWDNIDFSHPITAGPNELGFDYFFGISASLDMHPYVYIRNDRVTSVPTNIMPASEDIPPFGGTKFWREGPIGDDFRHIEVLDKLTSEAVSFINRQTESQPFFLYFPLTAPHKPIIPNEKFQNKSGLNAWGDFVMQVDWTVGQVTKALEEKGFVDNTLLVVTSDNGATLGADFPTLISKGHDPSSIFRGQKADIYEGGHRVPFVVRWPSVVRSGTTATETICHTDLMATVADITGYDLPANAAEDSVSLMPLLTQVAEGPLRESTVHHSVNGSFAIRAGHWKLALCPGSGGWSHPTPAVAIPSDLPRVQLFHLAQDTAETTNLESTHPEIVQRLTALLQQHIDRGRSVPGAEQPNDAVIQVVKQL